MSKTLTLSLLLLALVSLCLPLHVFAQTEVECWKWDSVGGYWYSLGVGDPSAPARCWSSFPQSYTCLSDTIQWIEWAITGTQWEWFVRDRGIYAANAITFMVASDSDVVIDYEGFEALKAESTGVDSVVRIWYATWGFGSPPPLNDPAWVLAEDLNSDDDTLYDSPELEQGLFFKEWNQIEVKESYPSCDYSDSATVYFRTYGTCDESHPISVVVHYQPLSADFVASPLSGSSPLEVSFTDLSTGNPTSWFWHFGDEDTDTVQNPMHTYHDSGYYDAKLVVENEAGSDSIIKEDYIHVFLPDYGPVAYWSFDEGNGDTAHDYSGYGNDGTIYGASWTNGISGSALDFDGEDDYIEVAADDNLNFGSSIDFTFGAWIKAETIQLIYPAIIGRRNPPAANGYVFFLSCDGTGTNGRLAVQLNNGTHYTNYRSTSADLRDNIWHHVAATGDRDGFLTFYVDGNPKGQFDISDMGNINSTSNVFIGWEEQNPDGTHFNGIIDEVRIYNRALSQAEIRQLYGAPPMELLPIEALSFQNEGTLEYDDLEKIMSLDSTYAPTTYGTVVLDYYANGTMPDWFDAVSLAFDVSGVDDTSGWSGFLQAYIEKGDCAGAGCDTNWHHFITLPGEKNPSYQDDPPSSLFKSFDFDKGWIYDTIPGSWITDDTLEITLRLWNARVDVVRLIGPGGLTTPNTFITSGPFEYEHVDTNEATFIWTGTDDSTSVDDLLFSYSLDSATFSPFSYDTSHTFTGLDEGWHTFMVRAMDESQNIDPTPATRHFAIDITPPNTELVSGPAEGEWIDSTTVTFEWTGSDNLTEVEDLLFSYKIDDDTFSNFTLETSHTYNDLPEGPHTFVVKAKDKAGNVDDTPVERNFSIGLLNLQPVDIVAPDSAFCNQKIELSWTVINNGMGPAVGTWIDKIYLSDDDQLGSDTLLAGFPHTDSLDPGQSYTVTDSVFLPDSIEGLYWIVVGSEGGNFLIDDQATSVSIPPHPDLQVTDIQVPEEGWSGQGIYMQWTVKNFGDTAAEKSWTEYVYLSDDDSIGSDVKLSEFNYTYGLGVGESYTHIHPVTLPEDTSGNFWIVVKTDAEYDIDEYELENNNFGISVDSLSIYQTPYPDLQVTLVEGPPSAVSGQSIEVSWTVTNNGSGATDAPVWYDLVYLSMDTVVGAGDFRLGSFQNFSYLGPGESYQQTKEVVLPWQLAGPYYLVVLADGTNLVSEHAGEGNNSGSSDAVNVEFAIQPQPYLQITDVQVPSAAWSGEDITVTWIETNVGSAPTWSAWWDDAMALSQDEYYDATDIWLSSHFFHYDTLYPAEADTSTDEVRLPDTVSGTWYLIIIPDTHGLASAGGTPGAAQIEITPKPPADLEVTSISLSADTVNSGDKLVVDWTVTNNGLAPTLLSSWKDAVYLSEDDTLDPDADILLDSLYYTGNLEVDSSYSQSDTITIPSHLSGPYYVFVCTDVDSVVDEGDWEDNNCNHTSSPVEILFTPPDLQVSNIIPPSDAWSGQPAPVQWTVTNTGPGRTTAESWHDKIFISEDDTLNPDDDSLFYDFTHIGALESSESYTESTEITLPDGLSGTYYLFVVTDADSEVYEHESEDNNTSYVEMEVNLTPPPDLQVSDLSSPAQAWSGRSTPVQWNVINSGTGGTITELWHDKIYLSADSLFNAVEDTLMIYDFSHTGALGAGENYMENREVTIPSSISGIFYLFVYSDADSNVYEHLAEDNNLNYVQIQVSEPDPELPDLYITDLQVPTEVLAGASVTVEWTVTNIGEYPTPPTPSYWSDALYLSVDDTLDVDSDTILATFTYTQGLAPDGSYSQSKSVRFPNGISGQYYLFVMTDFRDTIPEDSEANNWISSLVQIDLRPPDLQVSVVDAPDTAVSGQPFTVNWSVENAGIGPTQTSEWYDALYLSKDQILDETDPTLGYLQHLGALDSAESYNDSLETEIPLGLSGPYYVMVRTDKNDDVYEHDNENNNYTRTQSAMQVILPPPVDLVVSSIDVPDSAIAGDSVEISWTVSNVGENTAQGEWTDALYLSADTSWDYYDDPVIGTALLTGGLLAGGSYRVSVSIDIGDFFGNLEADLPGVIPGDYHVIVRTDIHNNVSEIDETNNTGVSADTTSVDVTVLTLGVPDSSELSTGDQRYYRAEVGEGEDLRITLDCESEDAYTELYVCYGEIPDRIHYDFKHGTPFQPDQEIVVPGTEAGIYYILVRGDLVPDEPADYVIGTELLEFTMYSVSPHAGGTGGYLTLDILGAKFNDSTSVMLCNSIGDTIDATDIYFMSSTELIATYDLRGTTPNPYYDVVARQADGAETSLQSAFMVEEGGEAELTMEINQPMGLRPNQSGVVQVTVRNIGNTNSGDLVVLSTLPPDLLEDDYPYIVDDDAFVVALGASLPPDGNSSFSFSITNRGSGVSQIQYQLFELPREDVPVHDIEYLLLTISGNSVDIPRLISYIDSVSPEGRVGSDFFGSLEDLEFGRWNTSGGDIDEYDEIIDWISNRSREPFPFNDELAQKICEHIKNPSSDITALDGFFIWRYVLRWRFFPGDNSMTSLTGPQLADYDLYAYVHAYEAGVKKRIFGRYVLEKMLQAIDNAIAGLLNKMNPFKPVREAIDLVSKAQIIKEVIRSLTNRRPDLIPPDEWEELMEKVRRIFDEVYTSSGTLYTFTSRDPNEKLGPTPPEEDNLIAVNQVLPYTVYFENMPDATAPAQEVRITDQLDPDLDWRKFRLGEIAFGDTSILVPDNSTYWHTTVELDSLDLLLEIDAGINAWTGEVHWYFETIDPNTGQPPLDPFAGFLPPNDSTGRGEGHVSFTIKALEDLPDGTEITNSATIVFDTNDPIETNEVLNVTYTVLPDLLATSLGIEYEQVPLILGDEVIFNATIGNQGEIEAGSFSVWLFDDHPDSGATQICQAQQLSGIGPWTSREILFTCTPEEVSSKREIYVIIDPENTVEESNEDNNFRSINVFEIAYRPGDVNADGLVDIGDVVYLINYLFRGGPSPQPLQSGDMRCEGQLPDIGDVVWLINYLFRNGPAPCEQNPLVLLPCLAATKDSVQLTLSDIHRKEDGTIQIPIKATFNTYLAAFQFEIEYNPDIVQILEPELSSRTKKLGLYWGKSGDKLKLGVIDIYGKHKIPPASGNLLTLHVKMKDTRLLDLSSLRVANAIFVDTLARVLPVKVANHLGQYSLPQTFSLSQNYPNPFNPTTIIEYALPKDTRVKITIYNILGQKVKTLVDEFQSAGHKRIVWDSKNDKGHEVASGIYFYKIKAGEFTDSKKMVILK